MINFGPAEKYGRRSVLAKDMLRMAACAVVCAQLIAAPGSWAAMQDSAAGRAEVASADPKAGSSSASSAAVYPKKVASDSVLRVMQTELSRANSELG